MSTTFRVPSTPTSDGASILRDASPADDGVPVVRSHPEVNKEIPSTTPINTQLTVTTRVIPLISHQLSPPLAIRLVRTDDTRTFAGTARIVWLRLRLGATPAPAPAGRGPQSLNPSHTELPHPP